ncbi:MAG: hypothetical protein DI537_37115, partial [Stutzerimonas stutzeri]
TPFAAGPHDDSHLDCRASRILIVASQRGRVVRIDTHAAAEKLVRYLLRHFDALVVDDGGCVSMLAF